MLSDDLAAFIDRVRVLEARVAELEAAPAPEPPPAPTPTGWVGDFDPGWEQRWNLQFESNAANRAVVADPQRGNVLRLSNPGHQMYGDEFHVPIPPCDEATLTYDVLIPAGSFIPTVGKLPGLAGKAPAGPSWACSGGGKRWRGNVQLKTRADCLTKPDGFSLRHTWHSGQRLKLYAYVPQEKYLGLEKGTPGTDSYRLHGWANGVLLGPDGKPLTWPIDEWFTVSEHARLNTPGQPNGLVECAINGVTGLARNDMLLRLTPDVQISQVFFSWVFGGDPSNYPPTAQHVLFDNVRVSF
jgi:hypothetical protein